MQVLGFFVHCRLLVLAVKAGVKLTKHEDTAAAAADIKMLFNQAARKQSHLIVSGVRHAAVELPLLADSLSCEVKRRQLKRASHFQSGFRG